jgi:hypothetical protein
VLGHESKGSLALEQGLIINVVGDVEIQAEDRLTTLGIRRPALPPTNNLAYFSGWSKHAVAHANQMI